jgi:FtsZ-binding cell division protein ZapB
MPDKKLTDNLSNNSPILSNSLSDNEIVKALECCLKGDYDKIINALCAKCPYCKNTDCKLILQQNALDLINRLQAEKERLKEENEWLREDCEMLKEHIREAERECNELTLKVVKTLDRSR